MGTILAAVGKAAAGYAKKRLQKKFADGGNPGTPHNSPISTNPVDVSPLPSAKPNTSYPSYSVSGISDNPSQ